jgi:hypothetical protein
VVRNDFLDLIMELRKRGKNEVQEDMPSTNNPKKDAIFRKFKSSITIRVRQRARALDHYLFA